jgi:methyl-accepting chemotaxis protein
MVRLGAPYCTYLHAVELAEKSGTSAQEIARLVKDIRQTIREAVESMEAGAKEVDQGVVLVEQSGQSLSRILDSARTAKDETAHMTEAARAAEVSVQALSGMMNSVAAVVESNRTATEQMAAASTQVTGAIQSIVSISQDNSSAVRQVAGQAEQMKHHSEELSVSAGGLANMALVLQQAAAPFKA